MRRKEDNMRQIENKKQNEKFKPKYKRNYIKCKETITV